MAKNGGAVYFHNHDMLTFIYFNVSRCEFKENEAFKDGGVFYNTGILVINAFFNFENCFFLNNRASRAGVIFNAVLDRHSFFRSSIFDNNIANSYWEGGGVINNYDLHDVSFESCFFILNQAKNKGGIGIIEKGKISITFCFFLENFSIKFGGCFVIQRDSALNFWDNKVIHVN
jgi:hypothetical protein